MKTIEIVNGRKVWAVDVKPRNGCLGCIYSNCGMPYYMKCVAVSREDNRNVIFQPYEEQEKTFTLSQINEVIESLKVQKGFKSDIDTMAYVVALVDLKQKLEQL